MKITVQEKEKLIVGNEYYTFYVDISKKGNNLRNYTGIMKVRLKSKEPSGHSTGGYYCRFEIIESKKLGMIISNNIHAYFNGYGFSYTDFYEDYDECVVAHDEKIINLARNKSTAIKERFLKNLINKDSKPAKTKFEKSAISWYKSLPKTEQKYISWLKHYYDEIY